MTASRPVEGRSFRTLPAVCAVAGIRGGRVWALDIPFGFSARFKDSIQKPDERRLTIPQERRIDHHRMRDRNRIIPHRRGVERDCHVYRPDGCRLKPFRLLNGQKPAVVNRRVDPHLPANREVSH